MFALQLHNTVGIDAIRAEALKTNAMLAKLMTIVQHKSKLDEERELHLESLGGRKKVLENDKLLTQMAQEIEGSNTPKPGKDGKAGAQSGDPKTKTESKTQTDDWDPLSAKERFEMRQPLSGILEANFDFYAAKLDAQVRAITNQIQKSTQQILRRLESGSWEKINHPEVMEMWKENVRQFSTSCVVCHFGFTGINAGYLAMAVQCEVSTLCLDIARLLSRSLRHGGCQFTATHYHHYYHHDSFYHRHLD
jgi:hypothetical protein